MWTSARSPGPTHVAAAMFTPASLIAAATRASAPGVLSISMTRSTAIPRDVSLSRRDPAATRRLRRAARAHPCPRAGALLRDDQHSGSSPERDRLAWIGTAAAV